MLQKYASSGGMYMSTFTQEQIQGMCTLLEYYATSVALYTPRFV